ncbi:flavodoxin family protein [Intestinimonas sp. HCP28S3_D6]|uniref:flavodoxin family protein n=1 Tax=Intestinimonas sp. HCP28S3_D6 TaxID=3438942 RepID=UPI003F8CA0E0
MRTLVLIGSRRKNGATAAKAQQLARTLDPDGQQTTIHFVDDLKVASCCGCNYCRKTPGCSQKDDAEMVIQEIQDSEAVIIASPVYFGTLSGQMKTLCDRLYPLYRGGGQSLISGKALYLVYTQHSGCDTYSEVRKANEDYLFRFLGFNLIQTVVVGKDGEKTY